MQPYFLTNLALKFIIKNKQNKLIKIVYHKFNHFHVPAACSIINTSLSGVSLFLLYYTKKEE